MIFPAVYPATDMNINTRARLAEAWIAQILLNGQTPAGIGVGRGQHQVNIRLHAGLQVGNGAAFIGCIQRDPDQAQGHKQHQRGQ